MCVEREEREHEQATKYWDTLQIGGQIIHESSLDYNSSTGQSYATRRKLLPPKGVYIPMSISQRKRNHAIDGLRPVWDNNIGKQADRGNVSVRGLKTYSYNFDNDVYGKEWSYLLKHKNRNVFLTGLNH